MTFEYVPRANASVIALAVIHRAVSSKRAGNGMLMHAFSLTPGQANFPVPKENRKRDATIFMNENRR